MTKRQLDDNIDISCYFFFLPFKTNCTLNTLVYSILVLFFNILASLNFYSAINNCDIEDLTIFIIIYLMFSNLPVFKHYV